MYTSATGITSKDITPKNVRTDSNPNNKNKIRKAWVLHAEEGVKAKLKSLPQEVKFMLYEAIDDEVSEEWVKIMKHHSETSIEAGAKIVTDKWGGERLESSYCVDSDDQLVQAGEIVASRLETMIAELPEAIRKQMS